MLIIARAVYYLDRQELMEPFTLHTIIIDAKFIHHNCEMQVLFDRVSQKYQLADVIIVANRSPAFCLLPLKVFSSTSVPADFSMDQTAAVSFPSALFLSCCCCCCLYRFNKQPGHNHVVYYGTGLWPWVILCTAEQSEGMKL